MEFLEEHWSIPCGGVMCERHGQPVMQNVSGAPVILLQDAVLNHWHATEQGLSVVIDHERYPISLFDHFLF